MQYAHYLKKADPSWHPCLIKGLQQLEATYLDQLNQTPNWLPGIANLFNAFSLPQHQTRYILFGESPYPRQASANGYAFWDAAVTDLWSKTGLAKPVNRATSLRNIIKMLLIAEGLLSPEDTGQEAIAAIDKSSLIQTNQALFTHLLDNGFLLLNATLVLQSNHVRKDALAWQPFIKEILFLLFKERPTVQLILLGQIANQIDTLIDHFEIKRLYAEHPYNLSFIHNPKVIEFFRPFHLLRK